MCVKNLPNLASIVWRKKIVVRFDEIFLTQTEPEIKKNEFWRKNIEIGYFPNTSLLEKYTQLQHAKHVLCMLLQAGKWYNYYLFFGAVIFDTRVMSSWEYMYFCVQPALFVIFFTLFVRTIRSYHHFTWGKKNLFKILLSENEKHIKEKKSVTLIDSIARNFKNFLVYYCKLRI